MEKFLNCVNCEHEVNIDSKDRCPECGYSTPLSSKCVSCNHTIKIINAENPCPNCGNPTPLLKTVFEQDKGKGKDLFIVRGYKFKTQINKGFLVIFIVLSLFSIIITTPIFIESAIGNYIKGWNGTLITIIVYFLTTYMGFKAFIKVQKPFQSKF